MKKKATGFLVILLSVLLSLGILSACGGTEGKLHINIPSERITAELGSYDLPRYDVVNEEGLIMANYLVTVESVKDPDGEDVPVSYGKINAVKAGVYTITYVAGADVPKATLEVEFADRTAPTVSITGGLPDFYIVGFTYSLPEYSIVGEPDTAKCYIKLYYDAEGQESVEVETENNRFTVQYNTGFYRIVIHAEDAVGNFRDYEYKVEAIGPEQVVDGKVVYFDEPFGLSQVKTLWSGFRLSYSTDMRYGEEKGSTKVVTEIDTDYVILDRIIEKDVSKYTHLVVRVYNDNDYPVYSGYCWFGDTTLAPKEWTEIKIPVSDLDEKNVSHPAVSGIVINSHDVTNLSLRLFTNYDTNKIEKNSTFYFSAMYAVTEEEKEPEEVKDDEIAYFDEEYGLSQLTRYWPDTLALSYDAATHYEEEAGSLKVTWGKASQEFTYLLLDRPYIKDVSEYDHLVFRVYNATQKTFKIGTNWFADTTVPAGDGWTEVKIPVAGFAQGKIQNMDGDDLTAADVTGFVIRIFNATQLAAGDVFYLSAMYGGMEEEKGPEQVTENEIAYFDEEFGLSQVALYWPDPHTLSFDAGVHYGDERGGLKVTVNQTQDSNYILLNAPYIKDISKYDHLVFRVKNPTNAAFKIGTTWAADIEIPAGADWMDVVISVSLFGAEGSVSDMGSPSKKLLATDISGLPIRIFNANSIPVGESFYLSAVFGVEEPLPTDPKPSEVVEDKIAYFDEEFGLTEIAAYWQEAMELSCDLGVHYGNEKGALKVTWMKAGQDSNYILLNVPYIKDISKYDHLVFRVKNPTNAAFKIGTTWAADIEIPAGADWMDVVISVSLFGAEGSVSDMGSPSKKLLATDISGLPIRIFNANNIPVGESFYLSAVFGVEEPLPTDPKPSEVVEDKIAYFDEEFGLSQVALYWPDPHTLSFDAGVHYGDERGSLKVTVNKTQDSNYILLNAPYIKDISKYDHLVFRVKNPTNAAFKIGTTWAADIEIPAGADWMDVVISVSLFGAEGSVSDMGSPSKKLLATDISGLPIRIFNANSIPVGESFYLSAVFGVKGEPTAGNVVADFDSETGVGRVSSYYEGSCEMSYSTEQKYGSEEGSMKVTVKTSKSEHYIVLNTPCIKDISAYDYIVFRVYNATGQEFKVGTTWAADTVISSEEGWTEVKIPVSLFGSKEEGGKVQNMASKELLATDVTGFVIRIFGAASLTDADLYISAIYGVTGE